jgi:glycosyltransferase involved in cell wall biosynthesis
MSEGANAVGAVCGSDGAVAIVIPCYNGKVTLVAAIESALAEDGVREIVVIDDGSTDGSLALARTFEPRVQVLAGPNQGVSAARNRGIAATKSEWLLFLDADDVLMPGTIARRLETARARPADVIICDWEETFEDGKHEIPARPCRSLDWQAIERDAELAFATHVWATTSAILYRRELVERIGGFRYDLPVIQDARFLLDAALHGGRFAHCKHVGSRYRVSARSLSRSNSAAFWQDVLCNGRQIEALWRARNTFDEARRRAVLGIYNSAARGLFTATHPRYFEAVTSLRSLGSPQPLHVRLAEPLARVVGLPAARLILSLVQRL